MQKKKKKKIQTSLRIRPPWSRPSLIAELTSSEQIVQMRASVALYGHKDFFVVLHITWWSKCFFSYMVSPRSCKVKAQKQWSKCADTQSKLCIIHKDAVSSIKETTFNSFSSADQNQYHCKQCRASVDSNEYKEPSYLDLHCLPFRFLYSWLSLSRPRLSRITAYFEVKIWFLPKHENLTIVEKRINCSLGAISPLFHNIFSIFLISRVQLHINLLKVVNWIILSSILQIWYVDLRISRSISERPLEFEITRIDCIRLKCLFASVDKSKFKNGTVHQTHRDERVKDRHKPYGSGHYSMFIRCYPIMLISNEPAQDKTYKKACAPSEDSDQPGHPLSLISLRYPMKKPWVLSYSLSAQRRLW